MSTTATATTAVRTLAALAHHGYDWATGVPCSLLTGLFRELEAGTCALDYVPAPREDTAVGMAVGAQLGGRRPVVLMQNSGLGYCLNVLTSLTLVYDVHPFLVVSWRGHDGTDAVEHDVIGRELLPLLGVLGIGHVLLDHDDVDGSVGEACALHASGRPVALLVHREV